ncbi:MAG: DsrE family protein [Sporolactobacillus sp.]
MSNRKVIFHIDELGKWPLLLGNIANLRGAAAEDVFEIEALANAEAVLGYAAGSNAVDQVAMGRLADEGVRFVACRNAMNGNHVTNDQLLPFVTTVPAGVLELADKQLQGYAYIKP